MTKPECHLHVGLDSLGAEVPPAGENAAVDVVRRETVGGAEDVDAAAMLDELVGPADALMVGDSEADIASARAAGVFSVAVRGGYCDGPLEELNPDIVIDSLYGFAEAVEAWRRHG